MTAAPQLETRPDAPPDQGPLFSVTWTQRGNLKSTEVEAPTAAHAAFQVALGILPKNKDGAELLDVTRLR